MPKDTRKYRYFQIGIGWDSWTLAQLEADAKLHQMEDQPAKLIVLRLTEYYKQVERGAITPGIAAMMQQPAPTSMNGYTSAENLRSSNPPSPGANMQEQQWTGGTVTESEDAGEAADAALDYFMMDDDE